MVDPLASTYTPISYIWPRVAMIRVPFTLGYIDVALRGQQIKLIPFKKYTFRTPCNRSDETVIKQKTVLLITFMLLITMKKK